MAVRNNPSPALACRRFFASARRSENIMAAFVRYRESGI